MSIYFSKMTFKYSEEDWDWLTKKFYEWGIHVPEIHFMGDSIKISEETARLVAKALFDHAFELYWHDKMKFFFDIPLWKICKNSTIANGYIDASIDLPF